MPSHSWTMPHLSIVGVIYIDVDIDVDIDIDIIALYILCIYIYIHSIVYGYNILSLV